MSDFPPVDAGTGDDLALGFEHAPRPRIWNQFRTRLLLWLIALSVVTSLSAGYVYYRQQLKFVRDEQSRRGATLISNLAGQSELGAYSADRSILTLPAQRTFAEQDVNFVVLYGRDGEPLIRLIKPGVGEPTALAPSSLLELQKSSSARPIQRASRSHIDFFAAITSSKGDPEYGLFGEPESGGSVVLGIAHLGLSRLPAQEKLNKVLHAGIRVALIILTLGVLLALFLSHRLAQPILALARGADALRRGELGIRLSLRRTDELGLLAEAFNRMSASLRDTVGSLAHLNRHLEGEVNRRTDALRRSRDFNAQAYAATERLARELEERNTALREQRDKLEEMSRLKSEFLANISHELRTPLNAVIGYSELLSDGMYGDVNGEQTNILSSIGESASNLLAMINEILDLSRIEAGKMPVEMVLVDLRRTVGEVLNATIPLLRERPYQISTVLPPDPVEIITDPTKVRQILVNLVGNAIKFTREGSVSVTLSVDPNGGARIAISDTGVGIDAAHLEAIFDRFHQVDGSSTREHGGTGLGLAISQKVAALIGGEIAVESTVGKGSTFTLVLPFTAASNGAKLQREATA